MFSLTHVFVLSFFFVLRLLIANLLIVILIYLFDSTPIYYAPFV